MTQRLSFIIQQLMEAKTIAEKRGCYPMLCYLLDLAIVEAEEQRDRKSLDGRPYHADSHGTAYTERSNTSSASAPLLGRQKK